LIELRKPNPTQPIEEKCIPHRNHRDKFYLTIKGNDENNKVELFKKNKRRSKSTLPEPAMATTAREGLGGERDRRRLGSKAEKDGELKESSLGQGRRRPM